MSKTVSPSKAPSKAVAAATSGKGPSQTSKSGADGGEEEEEEKKQKPKHPLIGNADPNIYPFKKTPDDYNFSYYFKLKKEDFVTALAFYEYRIAALKHEMAKYERKIKDEELGLSVGGVAGTEMRKLRTSLARVAELKKNLQAAGVDTKAFLAQIMQELEQENN